MGGVAKALGNGYRSAIVGRGRGDGPPNRIPSSAPPPGPRHRPTARRGLGHHAPRQENVGRIDANRRTRHARMEDAAKAAEPEGERCGASRHGPHTFEATIQNGAHCSPS